MRPRKLRAGPLEKEIELFEAKLRQLGYSPSILYVYPRCCRWFDDYLARRGVRVISDKVIEHVPGFHEETRCRPRDLASGSPLAHRWTRALDLLFADLRHKGLLTPLPAKAMNPQLAGYLDFLRVHRGLSEDTLERHRYYLEKLLDEPGLHTDAELRLITITDLDRFIVNNSHGRCRKSMEIICGSVRGFVRHLFVQGVTQTDLSKQVIVPRLYSLEKLPRSIPWKEIERTLAIVPRKKLMGLRDYAILLLLALCGFRASEVAGLRLGDIHWSRDVIHLRRPKTRSMDRIPLVQRVGEALLTYLGRRPFSLCPQVFLTVRAPIIPLDRFAISNIARQYLLEAKVQGSRLGSHTFRHSHAMHLLRRGFSLKQIGDVLGHHSPQSTLVYTKAAVDDLREVAQEIPEVLP